MLRRCNLRVGFALFTSTLFLPGFLPPLPVNNVKYFEQRKDVPGHLTSSMFSFIGTENKTTTQKGPKAPFLCNKNRFLGDSLFKVVFHSYKKNMEMFPFGMSTSFPLNKLFPFLFAD